MMDELPGYGDEQTWPPYSGAPHDPRAPMDDEAPVHLLRDSDLADLAIDFYLASRLFGDDRDAAIDSVVAKMERMANERR